MKLQGAAAERYCEAGDGAHGAVLLHGPDPAFTAEMRRRLMQGLERRLGGEAGFSVTRLEAAETRRDPAALHDALRAGGFFGDRPLVLVTGAGDGHASAITAALDGLGPEDGVLVAEAGALTARSALRKLFEGTGSAVALGLYPDPPDPPALEAALRAAGLKTAPEPAALARLAEHAAQSDRGSLARTIERVALYGHDRASAIDEAAMAALLPATAESETDGLVGALTAGAPADVAARLRRLSASGAKEVGIVIQVGGHFRQLLAAARHPRGPQEGLSSLRPPVWGPRRDAMAAALARWSPDALERAVRNLHETDRLLRSSGARPDYALLERCLLRLAISGPGRG